MRLVIKFWKTFCPRNNRSAYADVIHDMHETSRPIRTQDVIGYHGNKAEIGSSGEVTVNELVAMVTANINIKKIILSPPPVLSSLVLPSILSSVLSTPLHSTPLHSTPLYSTLLHSTLLHSTPLHSTPLHSTLLHSTPLYSLYRLFASSAENRTRASCFGGGVPTTALSNGRCRG